MSKCELEIRFDRDDRTYQPGDPVRGEVVAITDEDVSCNGLSIELLWQTHGAGNTDRTVLDTIAVEAQQWSPGLRYRFPFAFSAPDRPLTYHGHFLNVDHCVAARADLPWARDAKVSEEYLLAPGPASHRDHLASPVDFTVTPAGTSGPVAKVIGWLLLPILLVLVVALLLMILPLVLVIGGVVLLRRFIAERRLGRVTVEVSAPEVAPPRPGGAAGLSAKATSRWQPPAPRAVTPGSAVRFRVRFQPRTQTVVDRVSVRLVGAEECRSGSGTNAKTHTHTVCEETTVLAEGMSFLGGAPVELAGELPLPDLPAYSFRAHSNALKWKLEVSIEVPNWPDWKREHPLALIPGPEDG
jgi:hypothetical protein